MVKFVQKYDLTLIKKHLHSSDLEELVDVEKKFVAKKYESKFSQQFKSEMPELQLAEEGTPQNL